MDICTTQDGSRLNVTLAGRLDTMTAPLLEAELAKPTDATEIHINVAGVDYVSSAGLRVLLTAHKRTHGHLTLAGVTPPVMEVLQMTGFADILTLV